MLLLRYSQKEVRSQKKQSCQNNSYFSRNERLGILAKTDSSTRLHFDWRYCAEFKRIRETTNPARDCHVAYCFYRRYVGDYSVFSPLARRFFPVRNHFPVFFSNSVRPFGSSVSAPVARLYLWTSAL